MNHFAWFDETGKRTPDVMITTGIQAYVERFQVAPRVVVVNVDAQVQRDDIEVKTEEWVKPRYYQFRQEEAK